MDRTILHCDLNGFYASVECVHRPELRKVPMAVAGDPESRHGIILAKNDLAKAWGVTTAETIWQAVKKCPELTLVPPRHDEYERYSRLVNDIYEEFTDLVEPFGIDESWLDVTGTMHLFGSGKEIADRIRHTVKERLGLTISVGVSFNKAFAKLGSDYKKPDATTVISRDNYRELVHPLPVGDLLYVGKATQTELKRMYINTIGDLAAADRRWVAERLGKMGELIHDYANGIDDSPVTPAGQGEKLKSVGNGMTFKRNLTGYQEIRLGITSLADEVAGRMRRYRVKCTVVQVQIKDPNFKSICRQKTLDCPTNLAKELVDTAMELVTGNWGEKAPARTITLTGCNLVEEDSAVEQLSLFQQSGMQSREKQVQLENAIYKIKDRYGRGSITSGGIINNDIGIEK